MERLKFLGVHGMFGESLWVISARKKLFAQITLVLIFSLICIFFFANAEGRAEIWMRLIIPFPWFFIVCFAYNLIFIGLLILCDLLLARALVILLTIIVIPVVAYVVGIVFILIVSVLAYVVFVLEDVYGRKAMSKSKAQLKGKLWSIVCCFVLLVLCWSWQGLSSSWKVES
ncbi:hypothetical protein CRG98_016496 [Punica granatum]|uniref:Uncharacterized protein n=1 Tax=Punica granatum TaxID=22663 RepID=A0A2I0K3H3_PUNGR|nr:hypothetical protein CRG98_016496 [Punica granatum]